MLKRFLTVALPGITGCCFPAGWFFFFLNHAQAPHAPWMCILDYWPPSLEVYPPARAQCVLILPHARFLLFLPAGAIMVSV